MLMGEERIGAMNDASKKVKMPQDVAIIGLQAGTGFLLHPIPHNTRPT
jgi:hypothetical protein